MKKNRSEGLDQKAVQFSRLKKTSFKFFTLLWFILVFFLAAEVFIRMKGIKPYRIENPDVVVEPGGQFYKKNELLGYSHLPGQFKITIKKELSFQVTNKEDSYRITHPFDQRHFYTDKEKMWIMGCSYTYGWALNDEDTFPWLLQEKIPEYEIKNYGVCGYGNIHSLIQIKEFLKESPKPKMIIVTYATFHDSRNTFSRARRKAVSHWNFLGPLTQPYASLKEDGQLKLHRADEVVYRQWPFMQFSALIHYFEKKYNSREIQVAQPFEVSQAVLSEIFSICKKNGITLIVAGIKDNLQNRMKKMLDFCKQSGMVTVDISVDVENEKYTHLPYDAHPNELANRIYAEKLFSFLKKENLI
jgi:hypothetical protein